MIRRIIALKRFIIPGALLAVVLSAVSCFDMYNDILDNIGRETYHLYIADSSLPGLYIYDVQNDGSLTNMRTVVTAVNPQDIEFHPAEKIAYVSHGVVAGTEISIFDISADGTLSFKNGVTDIADNFFGIACTSKHLYAGHSGGISLMVYSIGSNGLLTRIQDYAGTYFTNDLIISPDNNYLYRFGSYFLNKMQISGHAVISLPPVDWDIRTAPIPSDANTTIRNLSFHPSGGLIFVSTANGSVPACSGIYVLDTNLNQVDFKSTGAPNTYLSAIHPNGRLLFVTTNTANDIRVYGISDSGILTEIPTSNENVTWNERLVVHPNGKFLYVQSQEAIDKIHIFKINDDGMLTPIASSPIAAGSTTTSMKIGMVFDDYYK